MTVCSGCDCELCYDSNFKIIRGKGSRRSDSIVGIVIKALAGRCWRSFPGGAAAGA